MRESLSTIEVLSARKSGHLAPNIDVLYQSQRRKLYKIANCEFARHMEFKRPNTRYHRNYITLNSNIWLHNCVYGMLALL